MKLSAGPDTAPTGPVKPSPSLTSRFTGLNALEGSWKEGAAVEKVGVSRLPDRTGSSFPPITAQTHL